MITFLAVSGLVFPLAAAIIGGINVFARILYTIMYRIKGSEARKFASIAGNLPNYGLGLASFIKLIIDVCK